jgi:hypothetical protein
MFIYQQSARPRDMAFRYGFGRMKSILVCVTVLLAFMPPWIAAQTTPTLADILEQAAFQQDTANDPQRAINLYRQVIESEKATRQMIAQALYNTGLCYAKLKQSNEARQAFGAVVSQYKGVEPYYRLANAQLNPSFSPTPPRWQDGERLEYEIRAKNSKDVGNWYWTTTTNRSLGNNGLSMTIADEKTLRPLSSRADNPNIGHATATWTENSIEISRAGQERTETRFDGVVYDGEQQFWLLRQIPMSVGTKIRTNILPALITEKTVPFEVEVTGEERIQVPAGQFDAYKLGDANGISNIWIDKGPERYLLKIASPTSTFELKRISTVTPTAWRKVASGTSSFSLSIPDEWFNATRMGERSYSGTKTIGGKAERSSIMLPREEMYVLDDDTKLKFRIHVLDTRALQEYENFDLSLQGWVSESTAELPRVFNKFALREGSRADGMVANLPAISHIADYQERNEDWTAYFAYVKHDTKIVWIACLTPKNNFGAAKPMFDRLLSTITF